MINFHGRSTAKDAREMVWSVVSYRSPKFLSRPAMILLYPAIFLVTAVVFYLLPSFDWISEKLKAVGWFISFQIGFPLSFIVAVLVGIVMIYYTYLSSKNSTGSEVTIDQDGICSEALDGSRKHYYQWTQINKVMISENVYTFVFHDNIAIYFNKTLVGEAASELDHLLQDQVEPQRIKKVGSHNP